MNGNAKKSGGAGRKSRYRKEYASQARVACEAGGFSDAKLARLFSVGKTTVQRWRDEHEEFKVACESGKDAFAVATAEDCLLKRVKGYKYEELTYWLPRPADGEADGEAADPAPADLVLARRVVKELPPDVGAIRFLLTNREKARWSERSVVEGSLKHDLPEAISTMLEGIYAQQGGA